MFELDPIYIFIEEDLITKIKDYFEDLSKALKVAENLED